MDLRPTNDDEIALVTTSSLEPSRECQRVSMGLVGLVAQTLLSAAPRLVSALAPAAHPC